MGKSRIELSESRYRTLNEYTALAGEKMTSPEGKTSIINGFYGSFPVPTDDPLEFIGDSRNGSTAEEAQKGLANLIFDIENDLALPVHVIGTTIHDVTLTPNKIYSSGYTSESMTFTGSINLHAEKSTDQFFIRASSGITFGNNVSINLTGSASTCNIFWLTECGSIIFLGTHKKFPGIFIAKKSIIFEGVSQITGRVFVRRGTISFHKPSSVDAKCIIVCYLKGTLILTNNGFVPIENIKAGDKVMTKGKIHKNGTFIEEKMGKIKSVVWISKFKVKNMHSRTRPICIKKGALGVNTPFQDLYVSPGHRLLLNGKMVPAINIVNGYSIYQDRTYEQVEYYHLECRHHRSIFANGVLAESYIELDNNRSVFENRRSNIRKL